MRSCSMHVFWTCLTANGPVCRTYPTSSRALKIRALCHTWAASRVLDKCSPIHRSLFQISNPGKLPFDKNSRPVPSSSPAIHGSWPC
ncbi:hypothetical protein BDV11DRAFT_176822 [Aspergillus similis]